VVCSTAQEPGHWSLVLEVHIIALAICALVSKGERGPWLVHGTREAAGKLLSRSVAAAEAGSIAEWSGAGCSGQTDLLVLGSSDWTGQDGDIAGSLRAMAPTDWIQVAELQVDRRSISRLLYPRMRSA